MSVSVSVYVDFYGLVTNYANFPLVQYVREGKEHREKERKLNATFKAFATLAYPQQSCISLGYAAEC